VYFKELGRDLIGGMSAYHSVQNVLCVRLLTGSINSEMYRIRILSVYGSWV
jgi:hypothetical protein